MELKRLCIPDFEKGKGLVWVVYPAYGEFWWQLRVLAELKIKQERN